MIKVENLTQIYPDGTQALIDLNLVLKGGIIGLVGPNGAGKTTLMRILATLLRPTKGQVSIFGNKTEIPGERDAIRCSLGYLPQATGFYPQFTVEQNLDYFALLKRIPDRLPAIDQCLDQVGLQDVRRQPARTLSGGMIRRLGIAITLLNNPRLVIVDEPTVGLDPVERVRLRNVLSTLGDDRTIILSTHLIEDVQQVGQQLVILNAGKVTFFGTPRQFIQQANGAVWAVDLSSSETRWDNGTIVGQVVVQGRSYHRVLAHQRPSPTALSIEPSLEDAYLLMQSGLHNDIEQVLLLK